MNGTTVQKHPLHTRSFSSGESPTVAIVRAVATYEDADPLEVAPLYDAIDPDALNALVDPHRNPDAPTETTVEFPFEGYWIRVSTRGTCELYERQ